MNALQTTCTKRERTTKDRIITSVRTRVIESRIKMKKEYALIEVVCENGICRQKLIEVFQSREQAEEKRNEYGSHNNECRCLRIITVVRSNYKPLQKEG